MIDLLGFANHLELSSYDLRTNIGQEAIKRLRTLDKALEMMETESNNRPEFYPKSIYSQRINDAIFLTIDLDDFLKPSVGETVRNGYSVNDIEDFFSDSELESEESFNEAYKSRILNSVMPLAQFVGVVARMFSYINIQERESHFPGAKAVIASGFRMPFYRERSGTEDMLSANFSFSNAYIAEQTLRGSELYLDDYVIQMLCGDRYTRHLIQYAVYQNSDVAFDPLSLDDDEPVNSAIRFVVPSPSEVVLFRKKYFFRPMNKSPLGFLQIIPELHPYLVGEKEPLREESVANRIFSSIKFGPSKKDLAKKKKPKSWLYLVETISEDIGMIPDYLKLGKKAVEEIKRDNFLSNSLRFVFDDETED